jgi:hypothetical protein
MLVLDLVLEVPTLRPEETLLLLVALMPIIQCLQRVVLMSYYVSHASLNDYKKSKRFKRIAKFTVCTKPACDHEFPSDVVTLFAVADELVPGKFQIHCTHRLTNGQTDRQTNKMR